LQTPSRPLLNVDGRATPTDLTQNIFKPVESYTRKRKRQDLEETEIQKQGLPIISDPTSSLPPRTYFPASCEHEFGSLPIPPSSNRGKKAFPHNISFRTADWTTTPVLEDVGGYDVVIAYVPFFSPYLYPFYSTENTIFLSLGFQSPNGYI